MNMKKCIFCFLRKFEMSKTFLLGREQAGREGKPVQLLSRLSSVHFHTNANRSRQLDGQAPSREQRFEGIKFQRDFKKQISGTFSFLKLLSGQWVGKREVIKFAGARTKQTELLNEVWTRQPLTTCRPEELEEAEMYGTL